MLHTFKKETKFGETLNSLNRLITGIKNNPQGAQIAIIQELSSSEIEQLDKFFEENAIPCTHLAEDTWCVASSRDVLSTYMTTFI